MLWQGFAVTADPPVSGVSTTDTLDEEHQAIESKSGLILLAEDNELNREVINMQLSTLGYSARVTANGREALELWKNEKFDLVLTDCHMPEMDGFELTRALRKEEASAGGHVPIIAVTANTISEERDRCIESGMDDCLTKPVDMDELEHVISKWLSATTSA